MESPVDTSLNFKNQAEMIFPNILCANIRSINSKFEVFRDLVLSKSITHEILALQETWLNEKHDNDDFDIPFYKLFRSDRTHSVHQRGGGVALYLNNNLKSVEIFLTVANDYLDLVAVKVNHKSIIASIYINHKIDKYEAIRIINKELLDKINPTHFIFLCGDFNNAPTYTDFTIHGLSNVVTFPTRNTSHLDQIWTNINAEYLIVNKYASIADHNVISCICKYSRFNKPRNWMKKVVKEVNHEELKCSYESINWEIFENIVDLEEQVTVTTDFINELKRQSTTTFVYYEDYYTGEVTTTQIKHARRKREQAFKNCDDISFKYWSKKASCSIAELNGKILVQLKNLDCKQYWISIKSAANYNNNKSRHGLSNNKKIDLDKLNNHFLRFEDNNKHQIPQTCTEPSIITIKRLIRKLARISGINKTQIISFVEGIVNKNTDTFIKKPHVHDYILGLLDNLKPLEKLRNTHKLPRVRCNRTKAVLQYKVLESVINERPYFTF
ncbi:hypothetical protein GQR58_001410 [Nymphon striatum]|nr:hypothetical protein GQR58_001410 [Nymphon striatum]